ncbi:MAG: hypothetical protein ACLGG7_13305 [Bacteriovoracia bacterium]
MRWLWILGLLPCLSWASLLVNGPNCLNTVLVQQGIAQSYRYTSNVEMQVVLESPLCRRLPPSQKAANTIGVVRDEGRFAQPGIYSHAYVYLGEGLAFEKIGQAVSASQRLGPERQILEDYEAGVLTRIDYYQCDGHAAWQRGLSQEQRLRLNSMNRFEEEISELMARSLHTGVERELRKLGQRLRSFGRNLRGDDFLDVLLLGRLVSLGYQLDLLGDGSLQELTRAFELDATRLPELPQVL